MKSNLLCKKDFVSPQRVEKLQRNVYFFKSETSFFLKVTFSGKLHLSVTFGYISKFPLKLNELPWSEAPWTVV